MQRKTEKTGGSNGYMWYVEGKYILFASEQEYFEFMED